MDKHFHWKFQATDEGMINPVEITVIGYTDEASALYEVEQLIKRQNYKLIQVWECNQCQLQNKMINFLKKWSK